MITDIAAKTVLVGCITIDSSSTDVTRCLTRVAHYEFFKFVASGPIVVDKGDQDLKGLRTAITVHHIIYRRYKTPYEAEPPLDKPGWKRCVLQFSDKVFVHEPTKCTGQNRPIMPFRLLSCLRRLTSC